MTGFVAAVAWAGACSTQVADGGDSESHFLARCTDSCPSGLECVCGVCTKVCEQDAPCDALHDGAECVPHEGCGGTRYCDLACGGPSDCRELDEASSCIDGACRERSDAGLQSEGGVPEAGADGRASSPDATAPDGGACCLPGTLEFSQNFIGAGGFGPPRVFSACRHHSYTTFLGSCENQLPGCDATATDTGDLIAALEHPDVVAAFAAAPVIFGWAPEGEGTTLTLDGKAVWAAAFTCADGDEECTPIPSGVSALIDVIERMDEEGALCTPAPDGSVGMNFPEDGREPFRILDGSAGDGSTAGCCLPAEIEWYTDWEVAEDHRLASCRSYERTGTEGSCEGSLGDCEGSQISPRDVAAALDDPDVQAALAAAPVVYGLDKREIGGVAVVLRIDDREITIGDPCLDAPGCVDVPPGVQSLLDLLQVVEGQMLALGGCIMPWQCFDPPGPEPCDGDLPRFRYDAAEGRCVEFSYGGCATGANNFQSLAACESACRFDPCLYGAYDAEADGGACDGTWLPVADRCFENGAAACACECVMTGESACGPCARQN